MTNNGAWMPPRRDDRAEIERCGPKGLGDGARIARCGPKGFWTWLVTPSVPVSMACAIVGMMCVVGLVAGIGLGRVFSP